MEEKRRLTQVEKVGWGVFAGSLVVLWLVRIVAIRGSLRTPYAGIFIKALRWRPASRLEGRKTLPAAGRGDSPQANQLVVLTSHLCSHKDNPSTSETSSDATNRWM